MRPDEQQSGKAQEIIEFVESIESGLQWIGQDVIIITNFVIKIDVYTNKYKGKNIRAQSLYHLESKIPEIPVK